MVTQRGRIGAATWLARASRSLVSGAVCMVGTSDDVDGVVNSCLRSLKDGVVDSESLFVSQSSL